MYILAPPIAQAPPAALILMIDDTPANLAVIAGHLEDLGFQVAVAQDGEEGIQRAELIQPDLILLDAMMPGIDGFETCRRLKASDRTRAIPVIFMTALDEPHHKVAGFAAGGVDYVAKPFQIEEVMARINTHLALSAAFKRVADRNMQLNQSEQELQLINNMLEERVRVRTAELVRINIQLNAEIIERRQVEDRIRHLAHHDALTGLPNRILLEDRVKQAIAQAPRHQDEMVAVLFIDLDHFKTINDSLGHQIGDALLCQAALRLQECVRVGDSVARLGGDEFVISLPALTRSTDAALVASKVLAALDLPFAIEEHELHISGSIGISLYPDDGNNVSELMRAADAAMYHAKKQGRGNYQFFTAELNQAAQQRMSVANSLRQALAQDKFTLHYQPQVNIETGQIFSAEALLRLNLPGQAPISCGEFITVAEETGLIIQIGEWALRQACEQLKVWRDTTHPQMRIAVNLSGRQFLQQGLVTLVAQVLAESGIPADALDLEITESMLMQPSQDNLTILKELKAMGVQLSIDDFGTGYSSLAYLQHFPVHTIKIDRSFIVGISQGGYDAAIVTAIIAMAHSLHLDVIAEGVDCAEQVRFLKDHGCMAAQGFFYSKAVSAQAFGALLEGGQLLPGYAQKNVL